MGSIIIWLILSLLLLVLLFNSWGKPITQRQRDFESEETRSPRRKIQGDVKLYSPARILGNARVSGNAYVYASKPTNSTGAK